MPAALPRLDRRRGQPFTNEAMNACRMARRCSFIREVFVDGFSPQTLVQPFDKIQGKQALKQLFRVLMNSTRRPRRYAGKFLLQECSEENSKLFFPFFLCQRVPNGAYHAIHIFDHVIVPKADDFVTLRFEILGSFFVILFLFQMLTAVHFDDEFFPRGAEIGDVGTDGVLTAETASQLVAARERPEFALGGGEGFAELTGFFVSLRGGSSWGHGRILPPPVLPQILWIWGRCPKDGGGLNLQHSPPATPETAPPPDAPPRLDGRAEPPPAPRPAQILLAGGAGGGGLPIL